MDLITTQERTTVSSRINDEILIVYGYESVDKVPIETINGTVRKNEKVIGHFNASKSGESGLTFMPGNNLSVEEKQLIASRVYAKEQSLFSADSTDN